MHYYITVKKKKNVVCCYGEGVLIHCYALQRLQVPNIPISKCAACLKPPVSEEDKLKRCTRCYRVGYCNQ